MRKFLGLGVILMLTGCGAMSADLDDYCRDSSRCTPQCGSGASGASADCDPRENEGRTRG